MNSNSQCDCKKNVKCHFFCCTTVFVQREMSAFPPDSRNLIFFALFWNRPSIIILIECIYITKFPFAFAVVDPCVDPRFTRRCMVHQWIPIPGIPWIISFAANEAITRYSNTNTRFSLDFVFSVHLILSLLSFYHRLIKIRFRGSGCSKFIGSNRK